MLARNSSSKWMIKVVVRGIGNTTNNFSLAKAGIYCAQTFMFAESFGQTVLKLTFPLNNLRIKLFACLNGQENSRLDRGKNW